MRGGRRNWCRSSRPRATASTCSWTSGACRWPARTTRRRLPGRYACRARTTSSGGPARAQYDLIVYQLGNSRLHGFIWPYLFRWPGLAVLHDAPAASRTRPRAASSRTRGRLPRGVHLEPSARRGRRRRARHFRLRRRLLLPMAHDPSGRRILAPAAVHSRGGVAELSADWPDRPIEYVALGEGQASPVTDAVRNAAASALAVSESTVLFGVFGCAQRRKAHRPGHPRLRGHTRANGRGPSGARAAGTGRLD